MFSIFSNETASCVRDAITCKDLLFKTREDAEEFARKLKLLHIAKHNLQLTVINVDLFEHFK